LTHEQKIALIVGGGACAASVGLLLLAPRQKRKSLAFGYAVAPKQWMHDAYEAGKRTADRSYEEIVYGELAPGVFDDHESNVFFEAGRRGLPFPQFVCGWRYGSIPFGGRSFNHREGVAEVGLSVMGLEGEEDIKTISKFGVQHRPRVRVCGWLHPYEVGGDGEPLLLLPEERPSGGHFGSMTQKSATALMQFLSGVAEDLGVGRDAYVVGGAVRNYLVGRDIKDLDIVVDAVRSGVDSEEFAKAVAARIPAQTNLTTNQYGVAILTINDDFYLGGENLKGEQIEIANARKESYGAKAGKGYKPHMVEKATIEEDVARREFSMNTLLWQLAELAEGPEKAEILDITGCGLRDLRKGELRCPSDPDKTMSDDPTRMLRSVKFATKYGFTIPKETANAIRRNAHKIRNAPHEAISTLLLDVLLKDKKLAQPAMRQMKELGILDVVGDMYRDVGPFRTTLNNWASEREVQFMFDLADVGFPTGPRIQFLTPREQARFRKAAEQMDPKQAKEYRARLAQPGRAFEDRTFMPRLMQAHGVQGKAAAQFAKRVQTVAKQMLLDDPSIAFDPARLRSRVEETI
jgi:tRNA nucleotidyltransferase/poly(A) polymerase